MTERATEPARPDSRLGNQLARQRAEELARAIRSLLARPLLTATADPAAFDLVRRHAEELTAWFDEKCGWRLVVEPRRGYARLAKVTDSPDATRPARRRRSTRAPFDRRRYVLLCVIAAELARPGAMTTIGVLAQQVATATATEPAIDAFDSARLQERAAFVDALRLLEHYGVVQALDGATDTFLDQADAKVLYQVDEARLVRLLAAPMAPSRLASDPAPSDAGTSEGVADLRRLVAEPRYGDAPDPDAEVAESQRYLWLRHSITRHVLDDPVVYHDELTEQQRAYLNTITGRRLVREAARDAGLELEERAEGLLAVDADRIATDETFPDERSHLKHAALLLLDELLTAGRPAAASAASEASFWKADGRPGGMPLGSLADRVESLLGRFPAWARAYQSEGGAARLAEEAVALLSQFGLATRRGDHVTARPAAARYAVTAPDNVPSPDTPVTFDTQPIADTAPSASGFTVDTSQP